MMKMAAIGSPTFAAIEAMFSIRASKVQDFNGLHKLPVGQGSHPPVPPSPWAKTFFVKTIFIITQKNILDKLFILILWIMFFINMVEFHSRGQIAIGNWGQLATLLLYQQSAKQQR